VRRLVRIGISDAVSVPVTLGFRRPFVLIPASMVNSLTEAELTAVLAHELAHVVRRDDWARLVQRGLSALSFFQPAAHYAANRIEIERELACDDWVIERTGVSRAEYASHLLRVGELAITGGRITIPATGVSMASYLAGRIHTLLSEGPPPRTRMSISFTIGLVLLLVSAGLQLGAAPALQINAASKNAAPADTAIALTRGNGAQQLAKTLERYEEWGLHGAVLVVRQGSIVLREGYGLADRARGTRWTPETAFNGGAVAKMLTAAAILKLEEQGRLHVMDPVSRHLGEFPPPKNNVTIHQLLTHTAGLARAWAPIYREDRDAFVHAMKATPAEYPAGQGLRYTDHGHALLAALIEVVTGTPYETYVRRELLEPAGMSHTRFENEPPTEEPVATEYSDAAGEDSGVGPRPYRWGRRGAMGVITTLDDLWKWHVALEQGRILNADSRARMFTGYTRDRRATAIGYGWEVGRSAWGTRIRHRLSAWSSNSVEILYDEDQDLFVALVSNAPTDWARPKYHQLVLALLEQPHLMPPEPANTPVSELARLEGRYTTDDGEIIDVSAVAPGTLHIRSTDGNGQPLFGDPSATVTARAVESGRFGILQWARHRHIDLRFLSGPTGSWLLTSSHLKRTATRRTD
jgi:CubicO group peptidase (beta-lactamase class C family)